jgi:thiosulfate reductase cytochrome b subunit
MAGNMDDPILEHDNRMQDQSLQIKIQIEQEKFRYRTMQRPLIWFGILLAIDVIAIILSTLAISLFGVDSFVGGWGIVIAIASVIIIIGMGSYFFVENDSNKKDSGFGGFQRIKDLSSLKADIEAMQIQLRILEEFQIATRPLKEKYAEEISQTIQQYTKRANRNRRLYYILQIIIIFCSLLVTGLTSGLSDLVPFFNSRWITPAISFSVSFLTAMITLFRFRERGHNLQLTADAIQYEISCATKGIYGYKGLSEQDAFIKLAEEVERLINEQRKRQQQLEQASEVKQAPE